jgi:hypothetical protein
MLHRSDAPVAHDPILPKNEDQSISLPTLDTDQTVFQSTSKLPLWTVEGHAGHNSVGQMTTHAFLQTGETASISSQKGQRNPPPKHLSRSLAHR